MALPAYLDGMAEALVRDDVFGQPVTLPDGTTVNGIFDPTGAGPTAPWAEGGLGVRISQQRVPSVVLQDAVAAVLSVDSSLQIDGQTYRVTAPPLSDGSGLTTIELAPATAETSEARWQ